MTMENVSSLYLFLIFSYFLYYLSFLIYLSYAIRYDYVQPRQTPEQWNLPVVFLVAATMAAIACLSSLLLLWFLLDSWQVGGVFQTFGLGGVTYGQVTTAIYLKVSVSDFLTLFSARTGGNWFYSTAPSPILLGAAGVALGASSIIACVWPKSSPDGILSLGLALAKPHVLALYIWIYCLVWWFIQVSSLSSIYLFIL